ncbi:MAG TPA: ketol-acid reductoisomerase, partial [Ilumatobacteraceae bacterium]|nr:ketol-acid reductoisomerase [Ilumatobacteraceae bacterium]
LEMKKILKEIQSGKFAKEWIAESEAGRPNMKAKQAAGAAHQIEEVGGQLRAMMPFLGAGKQKVADVSGG